MIRPSAALVGLLLALAPLSARAAEQVPLPGSIHELGSTWRADDGRAVLLSEVHPGAAVVSMVYTSCAAACPATVAVLKRVQASLDSGLRGKVQFILVSLDPGRDSPDKLRQFREEHRLSKEWSLLTGSAEDVRELAVALGVAYAPAAGGEIAHSSTATVIGADGRVLAQLNASPGRATEIAEAVTAAAARSKSRPPASERHSSERAPFAPQGE